MAGERRQKAKDRAALLADLMDSVVCALGSMAYGYRGATRDDLDYLERAVEGKARGILAEPVRLDLLARVQKVYALVRAGYPDERGPWGDANSELHRLWEALVKEAATGPNPFAAWAAQKRAAQKRKDAKEKIPAHEAHGAAEIPVSEPTPSDSPADAENSRVDPLELEAWLKAHPELKFVGILDKRTGKLHQSQQPDAPTTSPGPADHEAVNTEDEPGRPEDEKPEKGTKA